MLRSEWSVASPIFRKCPKLASATRKQNANLAGVGFSNNPSKPDVCSRGGTLEHSGRPPQFLDTQLHCPSNFKALFCCNCSFCFSLCSKKRFSICGSGGIFKLRWTCLWVSPVESTNRLACNPQQTVAVWWTRPLSPNNERKDLLYTLFTSHISVLRSFFMAT